MKELTAFATALLLGLGLVTLAHAPADAGAIPGPRAVREQVLAGDTDVYHVWFEGGELAIVRAVGDGDIDMEILDANGLLIASDYEDDQVPVCTFTPRRTGLFTIRIVNSDDYDVDYVLRTN
jgi:hypothetical protein